jgi:Na+-transporting NADH:ubiquinone oxidoreductase subunit F
MVPVHSARPFSLKISGTWKRNIPISIFNLALDRPDPKADAAGVKSTAGFVHQVMYNTYLKNHEAPEDIEYYLCGPGPMTKSVQKLLYDLGVDEGDIMFDDFS